MILPTSGLADLLGLSDRRINQLAKEGVTVRVSPGKFDVAASIKNYIRHVSAKAETKAAELDLDRERARLAAEQADGHSLKNAQMRGDLVSAEEVVREWMDVLRQVQAAILAAPSRIRQRIPGLPAAHATIIDRELRDALAALADEHQDDPPAGDAGVTAAPQDSA